MLYYSRQEGHTEIRPAPSPTPCPDDDRIHTPFAVGQELGRGRFAVVFAHPADPSRVIRIACQGDRWPEFARWVRTNPAPWAPEITSHGWFLDEDGRWWHVAEVERCAETVGERASREIGRRASVAEVFEAVPEYLEHLKSSSGSKTGDPARDAWWSALREALNPGHSDLHPDNAMVRRDGSVCITDPVSV